MGARAEVSELFDTEFAPLVRALGLAFTPESAADAVQEAFLVADRKWGRVSRMSDPAGWVRRVALNRLLNERRNVIRRAEILATIRPVPTEELTEERLDLRQAIEGLPQGMRVAVCLHYLADLPVAEVAELLDVSAGTVKSNLYDARQKLRNQLEERT